jgi:hypothetical protein
MQFGKDMFLLIIMKYLSSLTYRILGGKIDKKHLEHGGVHYTPTRKLRNIWWLPTFQIAGIPNKM